MKLNSDLIKEIAEELETGMKVYINRKTLEIKPILDWEDIIETEPWEAEEDRILNEWYDFAVITKMESRDAFRIMELFVIEIEDQNFREALEQILSRKSPFANFKAVVESSGYRQNWFDFRFAKYVEYLKEQLEYEGFKIEDSSTST